MIPAAHPAPRVAVIGAGVGGLACARALLVARPDLEVTIFEGSNRVGGKLVIGEVGGVEVDLGAESMLNRRPEGTDLARAVGLGEAIVHPAASGAGVWSRRRIEALPPTVMGVPVDPAAAVGILGAAGVERAALEARMPRLTLDADVGFGQLVAERLGPEVRDRLVEPLLGGVYAGRSDEISMRAAVPQLVAAVERHGGLLVAARAVSAPSAEVAAGPGRLAIRGGSPVSGLSAGPGRSASWEHAKGTGPAEGTEPWKTSGESGRTGVPAVPVFAGIRGGLGRLPEAVARDITARGGRVVLDAMVRDLVRERAGWRVSRGPTVDTISEVFDAVIVAVPGAPAARLLRAASAAAADQLASIEYASMAVVTMAFPTDKVGVDLIGTGFLVPPVDGRVIKAATYSSRKWGWLSGDVTLVRCSVGRHREEAVLQRDDAYLVEAARLDLRRATCLEAPLVDARVTRWGGGLPQYAVGHLDRVRRVREAVALMPGLEVCGAAYDGVGIPAVIAGGQAAATRLLAGLEAVGTMEA